jgi:hypothetical protein
MEDLGNWQKIKILCKKGLFGTVIANLIEYSSLMYVK